MKMEQMEITNVLQQTPIPSLIVLRCSLYLLTFTFLVYGLQVREQAAVRGREIIEWEGRQWRSNES